MPTRIITAMLLTVALAGGVVSAQLFSAEVTPNPVLQGKGISIKIECSKANAELASGCAFDAVYKDKPSGTPIYQSLVCPRIIRYVSPGQGYTAQWTCKVNNKAIVPGTYYVLIRWRTSSSAPFNSHFVPFRVDPAQSTLPMLATTTTTSRGKTLGIKVNSANQPGASYLIAASFTTNKGFQLTPKARVDLELDGLFWTSIALPNGPYFKNFTGVLDRSGLASASMAIPGAKALQGGQLSLQTVTVDKAGVQVTNTLTRVIL